MKHEVKAETPTLKGKGKPERGGTKKGSCVPERKVRKTSGAEERGPRRVAAAEGRMYKVRKINSERKD